MSPNTMPNWLNKRADLSPDRLAIITEEQSITFGELNKMTMELARKLISEGVSEGKYVGLLLDNSISMVTYIHALTYIGAVIVPLNTRLSAHELKWQLEDSQACLLVFDQSHAEQANSINDELVQLKVLSISDISDLHPSTTEALNNYIELNQPHTVIYTSGTTGHPKGVVLTHGNHWWSAVSSSLNLGIHHDDIWLACVPLFHVSGLSILLKSLIYGMTVNLHPRFDTKAVNEAIKNNGVTMISVVTVMLRQMIDSLGDERFPDTFRCLLLGGGPAPKIILDACEDRNIPVYQTYGLTETASQIVTLSPEYMLSKLGSAGKPLFPASLRIVNDGREVQANEPGEIVVSGPNITEGYLNRDVETRKVIQDGWLSTGDIGYVDEEGFLFVLDRRKDLILSGGENVYPAEIEAILLSHPNIEDAGVIGVSDERWGQVPAAFIKIKEHADVLKQDIIDFCGDKLAGYKVPSHIIMVNELPRNASNKLLRRKLLDYFPGK